MLIQAILNVLTLMGMSTWYKIVLLIVDIFSIAYIYKMAPFYSCILPKAGQCSINDTYTTMGGLVATTNVLDDGNSLT